MAKVVRIADTLRLSIWKFRSRSTTPSVEERLEEAIGGGRERNISIDGQLIPAAIRVDEGGDHEP